MKPDDRSPGGDVPVPADPSQPAPTATPQDRADQQSAAASVIRHQIDALYGGESVPIAQQPQQDDTNPYHRTHTDNPKQLEQTAEQWKEYHTAWQNYYQKYYENYYTHHLSKQSQHQPAQGHYFSHQPARQETKEVLTNDEALFELRQKLLGRVQESAKKIRKSRHFIPIAAALGIVLIFVFLQYNRVLIASVSAYVSPGSIDPQNIVIDPSTDTQVGPEPRLIIPKINVDVPVHYDVGSDNDSQMKAMETGVAHFSIPGASSHPGEVGNTAIAGHSSNDLFDVGDYKFIFAQLEKLKPGDTIYANYNSVRYTYIVTRTETVKPTEIGKLIYPTDKPVLTLITCTPLGTALNRLLVTAEQVSPNPAAATKAPEATGEDPGGIPGNSPTFFEKLFGQG